MKCYQKLLLIKEQPYGIINFYIYKNIAYEISFLTLFKNQNLKICHNQSDRFKIYCFYDLYTNYGIKTINVGPPVSESNEYFKRKYPHFDNLIYVKIVYFIISKKIELIK